MDNEYLAIASEIRELESLLVDIPKNNLIERMSLDARLATARDSLGAFLPQQLAPRVKLTFRGKPVFGSHGIVADFASKAAMAFSDIFVVVAADGLSEGLRSMGPIPNKEKNQLLITGTAIGSFGFEFELPAPEPSFFPELEKGQEAMVKIEALLRLSAEGSDDEVAEIIEEVHPRAVKKVYAFLDLLVQEEAWCGLEFADRFFRYKDFEQIKISSERLKEENIHGREETFSGEFQGVLPAGRTFEFRRSDQGKLIRGKVDATIDDPGILNRKWLHKPVSVVLHVMQVGQGRPRYSLMSLDSLTEIPPT
ncbi:MAG: hypothetical protein M0041_07650 [Nitrospiraceae bacterium]|jgi:hypothetical protein|nr:hypothetical protein [Nitrospiraceae bacterium]